MSFNLTGEEVAWLAGLLEGEGSFNNATKGYPRVQMVSTDHDIVIRSAKLVEANVLGPYSNTKWLGKRPQYRWYVNGPRAIELMSLLLPWMGERRSAKMAEALDVV